LAENEISILNFFDGAAQSIPLLLLFVVVGAGLGAQAPAIVVALDLRTVH
jgi:hypothetical protein